MGNSKMFLLGLAPSTEEVELKDPYSNKRIKCGGDPYFG